MQSGEITCQSSVCCGAILAEGVHVQDFLFHLSTDSLRHQLYSTDSSRRLPLPTQGPGAEASQGKTPQKPKQKRLS